MTLAEKKMYFIDRILTDTKYFFANKKEGLYKVLWVTKTSKKKEECYTLLLLPDVPFHISPLVFEKINAFTLIKAANKETLYGELEKFVDISFSTGYTTLLLETDKYFDEEDQYISEITAGVPFVDYCPDDAQAIYTVETAKNHFMRYEVYETAIKVSKDKIKNNTFIYEDFYTLWYPGLEASEQAMQSVLDVKDTTAHTFESFANKVREIEEHEQIEKIPEEIIFQHLVETDSYLSQELSELKLPILQTVFEKFDASNIEEGRIYFWIKKNEDEIMKSEINFFVLQSREVNGYIAHSCKLGGFRSHYRDSKLQTFSMSDEIQHLKNRVQKGFEEISQENMFEILTAKSIGEIYSQPMQNSVYLDDNIYDLYANIVQHWAGGSDKGDFTNHTLFFDSVEKRDDWMQQEVAYKKADGFEISTKKNNAHLIEHYRLKQQQNKKYQEQKLIKDALLNTHDGLKEKFSDDNYKNFMKYSPLQVIEGDYVINDSLLLNADDTSLFIHGDLIVHGTLMAETKAFFQSDHYLIVAGNVRVENFIQNKGFKLILFAKDFVIKNTTYLPAASRSWYIDIAGKLETDILIHAKDQKVKGLDEKLLFNHEYSTTNKRLFVDGFFNEKNHTDERFIFNQIKLGKSLLLDHINQDEIDDDLLLTSFKRQLRNWHELYFTFAGFELQDLEIGEHYGHYIESDQIVKDARHNTGMYLMSHDDYSLALVKADKPLSVDHISSKDLAYRFFWIMWTFSNWSHRMDGPMDYWKDIEAIDTRYNNGKSYFIEDPNLALYWIMHFGLLDDARYDEMKTLMQHSDHPLIQGALLFFSEFKKTKSYSIKIDYKQNETLFNQRVTHHKEQIKKAMVPEEDIVAYTMSQFEQQPERTLEFIAELCRGKAWNKISEYLGDHSYQTGFSFLHIVIATKTNTNKKKQEEISQWQSLFIREAEQYNKQWKQDYLLVDMFEVFYKELDYEELNIVLSLVIQRASSTSSEKIYGKMYKHFKSLKKPKELGVAYENRLAGFTKNNFDFQTFINKSQDIEAADKIIFIRACIAKDLFSEVFKDTTVTPYLLVWYMADNDFYTLDEGTKTQQINEVINHYKLSESDFNERYKALSKTDKAEFFKAIKGYF